MDDLRFYVLCNSISVISGRWADDNERLCAMEPRLRLGVFTLSGDRTRTVRSVGQRLTHRATGAPNNKRTEFCKQVDGVRVPCIFLCPATKSGGGVLCYTFRTFECLSVRLSVCPSVRPSVRPSVSG